MGKSKRNKIVSVALGLAIAATVTILGSGAIGLGVAAGLIGGVTTHGILESLGEDDELEGSIGIYESLTEIRLAQEEQIKKELKRKK